MFSVLRSRLTYANVAATLALLFAMSGGALAASHYLITSTKQISPKVLKALTGKAGKAGANGANGGAGANGSQGLQGAPGGAGTNGTNGTNGTSVTSTALTSKNAACNKEGGSEFTAGGSKTFACNGKEGSPWTAGGTLPSKASERGVWTVLYSATAAGQFGSASISFNIPLATAPAANKNTNFIGPEEGEGEPNEKKTAIPSHCKGTVKEPEAMPGNLCVFVEKLTNATPAALGTMFIDPQNGHGEEAGPGGAGMDFGSVAEGPVFTDGTWVVTAE